MANGRTKADAIILKALSDPDFRQRLASDPQSVLESEGISKEMAEDLGHEINIDGSDIITACSRTCSWTCSWTRITLA